MLTSIVGINWGDEGKGRMVDLLSQKYDVVVRYQGGNNAGHTVINDKGKFVLNLMPRGILRDETVNVLGPGMVIDTEHMFHEVERLRAGGITVTPAGERSKMTVGADGSVMHSLLGDKSGTVSVKLLKTSSVNAALQIMYNLQTTTGAQHGMNTIVIRDVARGDVITCQNCAFAKQPAITYGTDAGAVEWTFNAGSISFLLGM